MLVYPLSFLFYHTKQVSPQELLGVIFFLYLLLYISAPQPEGVWQRSEPKQSVVLILQDAWFGEISLWRAFWPYFLVLNAVLYAVDSLVTGAMLSVSSWDDVLIIAVCSSILWCVAVWRASANTGSRIWGAFARLATLCAFLDFILRIWVRAEYPSEFFNCQEMILNYTNCF